VCGDLAFGAFLLASGAWLIGLWILGVGVNYIPLAVYSIVMYPGDGIERELAGVDLSSEARRAGVAQFTLLVPFVVGVIGAARLTRRLRPVVEMCRGGADRSGQIRKVSLQLIVTRWSRSRQNLRRGLLLAGEMCVSCPLIGRQPSN
jgi:hypothetical protein